MSFLRLLVLNLVYHWRGNLAVFLGVALGTAVLTGALLVGDSLRGSLRALALDQLGWIDQGLAANRFFRARLAEELSAKRACPALILQGSGLKAGAKIPVNKITVLGVDDRFWPTDQVPVSDEFWRSDAKEVVLNTTLAEALKVKVGDSVAFNVQKANDIPRETLLGKRKQEDVVQTLEVKVRLILPDQGMARFTLRPSPEPVRNAFLPLRLLQDKLELVDRANALLVEGGEASVAEDLQKRLTLADWNLKLRSPEDRARALVRFLDERNTTGKLIRFRWEGRVPEELAKKADAKGFLSVDSIIEYYRQHRPYYLLESQQMLLEDAVVQAVHRAFVPGDTPGHIIKIDAESWWLVPTFIYLADSITDGQKEIPYAVIAAQGPQPQENGQPLQGNQIDLADWPEAALQVKPGAAVTLTYYAPDDHNHLQKLQETFEVRKLFPLTGRFDDPDLVPEFPGITDKLDMANWENPPFPYNPKRVKPADDHYWKRYRTTPRGYVNLETAQLLWGSRFGKVTSMQMHPLHKEVNGLEQSMQRFRDLLLAELKPEQGGFVFQNVREQGLKAGGGAIDFGEYFFYFSFFLIVAALLLVGLLFRLNLDRRGQEMGVLLASGWTYSQVRRLLLSEGAMLALVGAVAGLGGALVYADQLLQYLAQRWPGEQSLNFLKLHTTAQSFAIGLAASVLVSFLTILWATRVLSKMTPRSLLAGETTASVQNVSGSRAGGWSLAIAVVSLVGAVACLVAGFFVTDHMQQAGSFFGSGFLLLSASLALVWFALRRGARHSNPRQSVAGLGVRNAGRHAVRSVLTVGLLASASFLIVAVEAFHKEPGQEFFARTGGSGGFSLFAQADVPIFQDLNAPAVRDQLPFPEDARPLLEQVHVYSCRVHAGDDASCLNLYQPLRPRILGVPRALIERGGFAFAQTVAETDAEKENPWLLLEKAEKDAVPAFCDANSAQYILKVSLGGIIEVPDEQGKKVKLRIVGLFHESIFQSELVLAESNFRRLFPRQEGFGFFLLEGPKSEAEKIKQIKESWEIALADNGFAVESTMTRLAAFLAVENTYLSTFQALGGLGLLLGAVGLAIVLMRGVWERRGELALLRALGFRRQTLAVLVLAENVFLLLVGLAVGTVAALLAVTPHLAGSGAPLLWLRVLELLSLVVLVGLVAGVAAVAASLRAPLLNALRRK